ncbi:hypothetical protein CLSAB_18940 [Clostridium saccharobutylicum]|uniref:hypothetical protein n=1 Tax=Clostridium saccharobutylicum TaxID=169679 RepID=UPI00098C759A|nr:hypothetical protein [Clostridium saccharobutylicum]OOM17174.1 hypothetical protein CLSAB_18940 [Clostridium saccharobutylicum]
MEELKRIPVKLEIKEFIIKFEYETKKGHRRSDERSIRHLTIEDAKSNFKEWTNKSRTIFNAKILDIVEKENSSELIEL